MYLGCYTDRAFSVPFLTVTSIGELEGCSSYSLTISNPKMSITMKHVAQIDELTKEVTKLIEASEGRARSRRADADRATITAGRWE